MGRYDKSLNSHVMLQNVKRC